MPKVKDKERILQTAREKQLVTYWRDPVSLSADFSEETLQARSDWQSHEKQRTTAKITLSKKLSFRMKGQINSFPVQKKLKEFIITNQYIKC